MRNQLRWSLRLVCAAALAAALSGTGRSAAAGHEVSISGTRFLLDGKPFPYTGMSFFNALYNPAFNESPAARRRWLQKFQRYGINVLRVWGQWDSRRGYMDTCPDCTLYQSDGTLRRASMDRVKALAADADALGMVVQLVLFSQESWFGGIRVGPVESDRAVAAVTRELMPHRNVVFQIWNELSERVLDLVKVVRAGDPRRIVTNSPGFAGVLGDEAQNKALDYLTPHTCRQRQCRPWEAAPREIAYLLARYGKPVVDDEPARNGTKSFGGPGETTYPTDHMLQIQAVWQAGGYVLYHHDLFQVPGTPAVPPHGIPDPEFSPYHKVVFEFLALRDRYMPAALR